MKHGGDLLSYQPYYHGDLRDFSSNINPLGYPAVLDELLPRQLHLLARYPDIQYRALRQAIAAYLGCAADEVLVGNGSVEILDYFCREARRIVTCLPCFAEYLERPAVYGKPVVKMLLPPDFRLAAAAFADCVRPGDVVMVGNPNNPTGLRIPRAELLQLHALTQAASARLVLDEAFFEFCPADYDSIPLLAGAPNVCIIRAATKFFALPGLRLGYACAASEIAAKFQQTALPWRIHALADLAGQVIFRDPAYIARSRAYIAAQRQAMLAALQTIAGLYAYHTDANFILLKLLHTTENEIFQHLLRQGFLIRKASSFEGLNAHYIRIAVKDQANNVALIQTLREFMTK